MTYELPVDIGNRGLQRLGIQRILDWDFPSREGNELEACYDKLRLAELQRNLWTFSTRRAVLRSIGIDTVLWTPPTWGSGTSYSVGAVVAYTPTGGPYKGKPIYWELIAATSDVTTTPDVALPWKQYTGPVAVDLWAVSQPLATSSYQSGELVLVPATYGSGSYAINDVVNRLGIWYVAIQANTGGAQQPESAPTYWTPYSTTGRSNGSYGQTAAGSPIPLTYPGTPRIFLSLYSNNADNPVSATGNWLELLGTVIALRLAWPLGAGPSHDLTTLDAFRLPYGYLRRAPTDPKQGQQSYLGASSGAMPDDYVVEDQYIVSRANGPIVIRFVADVVDVNNMHPMYCEGLSARIALELAPTLLQDAKDRTSRIAEARLGYRQAMGEARSINAVEIGPVSEVENRYVTVRA